MQDSRRGLPCRRRRQRPRERQQSRDRWTNCGTRLERGEHGGLLLGARETEPVRKPRIISRLLKNTICSLRERSEPGREEALAPTARKRGNPAVLPSEERGERAERRARRALKTDDLSGSGTTARRAAVEALIAAPVAHHDGSAGRARRSVLEHPRPRRRSRGFCLGRARSHRPDGRGFHRFALDQREFLRREELQSQPSEDVIGDRFRVGNALVSGEAAKARSGCARTCQRGPRAALRTGGRRRSPGRRRP